ncbi:MAG TPA: cysteine desulfurase [Thermoanaerobaculia bacterium]|jgi:cysteine desulfurase/selenocysteine lyase|nr:cysteine desulfurase [Thermoanaerobaculia bacterium]HQP85594.1 cysteine desulfurase [Thermoanaerobaculia bacterium]
MIDITLTPATFDVETVRADFPILSRKVRGRPLVYLDSANTTQKPEAVIRASDRFYRETNANIHRSTYRLSEEATTAYEGAREKVRRFLNAASTREVVFTRGTTEAINLLASSFGQAFVKAGDEVLITGMEHHSNIVPWQLLCERTGARLRVLPIDDRGDLVLEELDALLTERTRILGVVHVSNALGTVNPVKEIVARAHAKGVPVLVDAAQSLPHLGVDVADLGCDFLAFSGHKVYGPTGIGVLWGKEEWLEKLPPYQGGGDMIASVSFEKTTYAELPARLEAGTGNLAGGVALGTALDYVTTIGLERIAAHERALLAHATERLSEVPGLRIVGTAREKAGVVSFVLDDVHPHDVGTILDQEGICIRTGHHCAQPVMARYDLPATARASFGLYNTLEEVDALVDGLRRVREVFGA